MGHWVGVDVGKTAHWVHVLDDEGEEVLSRKVQPPFRPPYHG